MAGEAILPHCLPANPSGPRRLPTDNQMNKHDLLSGVAMRPMLKQARLPKLNISYLIRRIKPEPVAPPVAEEKATMEVKTKRLVATTVETNAICLALAENVIMVDGFVTYKDGLTEPELVDRIILPRLMAEGKSDLSRRDVLATRTKKVRTESYGLIRENRMLAAEARAQAADDDLAERVSAVEITQQRIEGKVDALALGLSKIMAELGVKS